MGLDIAGQKFNKLMAIKFSHKEGKQKKAKWLFKCDCGNEKVIGKWRVTGGHTKSCGCLMVAEQERFVKNATTHGLSGGRQHKTPEYQAWRSLKARCLNSNDKAYKDYGGRGIKVCDRWIDSFENFINDMGKKPSNKHSIDRINNDGDYEPSNCRWATRLQQGRNKRGLRLIEIDGETKCITEWIEYLGLSKIHVNRDLYEKKIDILDILKVAVRGGDKKYWLII